MVALRNCPRDFGINPFGSGLIQMMATKVVPVWLVFATQNSLDIHHLLEEDISRGLQEFLSTCDKIHHRVKSCLHSVASIPGMDEWDDENHESFNNHPKTTSVDNEEYPNTVFALYPLAAGLRELHIVGKVPARGGRMFD
jgi:hypothetical protein